MDSSPELYPYASPGELEEKARRARTAIDARYTPGVWQRLVYLYAVDAYNTWDAYGPPNTLGTDYQTRRWRIAVDTVRHALRMAQDQAHFLAQLESEY